MSGKNEILHPLQREGTTQAERFPEALTEGYFEIEERSPEKLAAQMAKAAEFVRFYNEANLESGSWKPFFDELFDYENNKLKFTTIDELGKQSSTSPHLALFLSFLNLLGFARKQINIFTRKHLDFYYETLLKFSRKPLVPDEVVLTLELAKGKISQFIPAGTEFDAGNDILGKPLTYITKEDFIVNAAKVAEVKTMVTEKTSDGTSAILIGEHVLPIQLMQDNTNPVLGLPTQQLANVGFAFASAILNLAEGNRRITITANSLGEINSDVLNAEFTSPEGWTTTEIENIDTYKVSKNRLLIKIPAGLPAVVPYQSTIHHGNWSTRHPIIRITLKQENPELFAKNYHKISLIQSQKIEITVQVNGIKELILQSDSGLVDCTKPFYPFGTNPQKSQSTLYIGKPEVFNSYLTSFNLAISWKGLPGNISRYYNSWKPGLQLLFNDDSAEFSKRYFDPEQFANFEAGHPPGQISILDNGKWIPLDLNRNNGFSTKIFYDAYRKRHLTNADTRNVFKPDESWLHSAYDYKPVKQFTHQQKYGFVKIDLAYEFGQDVYPKLIAAVMMGNAKGGNTEIPEKPYIPQFNHLHIDYTAQTEIDFTNREEQLFSIHPFGIEEIKTTNHSLTTYYQDEGTLFIGLQNIRSPLVLSLYFNLKTLPTLGSEPDLSSKSVIWHYCQENRWQPFPEQMVLSDTTNGLLNSGIVMLMLPVEAMKQPSIINQNLIWISATFNKDSQFYPSLSGICTQALVAHFIDNKNDTKHLINGLPAKKISKTRQRLEGLKSIFQPDASFKGKPNEDMQTFYTRVSERLRHKQRAWNIWDYERLILNQFPDIYKVKCIPHASADCQYAPGNILLVVLPKPDETLTSLLTPKVSPKKIIEISEYISEYQPNFAQLHVANPTYVNAEITTTLSIKSKATDQQWYIARLNEALQTIFAPWLKPEKNVPTFGNKIYISQIINLIEELDFVEHVYATSVKLLFPNGTTTICHTDISMTKESEILTSVEYHNINIIND